MNHTDYIYIICFLLLLLIIYILNNKLNDGKVLINNGEILLREGKEKFDKYRWSWYGGILEYFGAFDNARAKIKNGSRELAAGKLKYKLGLFLLWVLLICASILSGFFINSIWNLVFG